MWTRKTIIYICIMISFGLLLGFNLTTVEAEPTYPKFELFLDNQPFLSETPLYRIDGEPAVPMRSFSEVLGLQANWFPETEEITLYRYNNFMRFKMNSTFATYNGYTVALPFAPTTIDKQIYIPLKSAAKAFDYFYSDDTQKVLLTTRDSKRFYSFGDYFLVDQDFPSYNYRIALPYGWKLLSENVYGHNDEYDDYNIRLGSLNLDTVKAQDLTGYRDLLKTELSNQYATKLKLTGEGSFKVNDHRVEFISYQLNLADGTRNYETFLVQNMNTIYTFDASFSPSEDLNYLGPLYRHTISTLKFPTNTISREQEHYVELSPFVSLGVQLTTPLSSNLEVFRSTPFIGSITHYNKVKSIYALVTKDNSQLKFNIPIADDGSFNTTLHTPFGAGKHNVELFAVPSDGSAEQSMILFSLVNLSNRVTRYLIPTKYIHSDDEAIITLAREITKDKNSSYFKVKALHDWIVESITPEFGLPQSTLNLAINPPRSLANILENQRATPLEYNLLLASMLRSLDYEAKVISAKKNNQLSFYVETIVNGRWIIMDPVSKILANEYPHLTEYSESNLATPINQFSQFHYLPVLEYQKLFDAFFEVE